jgi:hypothetical protein
MLFSKTFFTNLLRICSSILKKSIFCFHQKFEFEFINLTHFE